MEYPRYPFTAVVGQEQAKKGLLLALVNPRMGGLLISGKRGTAKSVLVRAAAPFTPTGSLVELPLGATDDMVFGSLDVDAAVRDGERRLRHGLLHRAAHTLIYMDEVNLLREEVLKSVLESASAGMFSLERDGVSAVEEISCLPVGTMDPAEGVLSPALLDSFGMFAAMDDVEETEQRAEIARRVLAFERAPKAFCRAYAQQEAELQQKAARAREMLPAVEVSHAILHLAAQYAARALCVGNRAEIYLVEAARALAALAGRIYVMPQDIEEAALFVLAHRMSRKKEQREERSRQQKEPQEQEQPQEQPQESQAEPQEESEDEAEDAPQEERPDDALTRDATGGESKEQEDDRGEAQEEAAQTDAERTPPADGDSGGEDTDETHSIEAVMARLSLLRETVCGRKGKSGRRTIMQLDVPAGRPWRTSLPRRGRRIDLAFAATLRAAAPYQRQRHGEQAVVIRAEDLRVWIRARRAAANILFLVDASGSMGAKERMKMVKGAVLALLREAYQKRDRVGLIAFRRTSAEMLLPMTRSVELAEKELRSLPTGGKTPLAEGLAAALKMMDELARKEGAETVLVLVTDGRTNVSAAGKAKEEALRAAEEIARRDTHCIVLDTEKSFPKVGLAPEIAQRMNAGYATLERLCAEGVLEVVRRFRDMQE
ncbi:VWA domain-containing protein [uncultured Selenomonas sp.]|uniref:VWA domain-containing protein n=1 Tax=uncultured Selenomonas sp. TaxID=159275 RepID=UPI0028D0A134|nr:VWA domain-containing protein [uncultured Selenomonas sp.]